jgi:hypothetical protein
MKIGIGNDGIVYTNRFNGWYETSLKTLGSDLHGGCYNDANPSPVTSVTVILAPSAPKARVDSVFSILGKDGWERSKVNIQPWSDYPRRPR